MWYIGAPGWRSRLSVRLQPGHDLAVREFEPHVRLWADGSEPGACFRFCVSLSLCPSHVHALSLSVPKINKRWKKKLKKKEVKALHRPLITPPCLLSLQRKAVFQPTLGWLIELTYQVALVTNDCHARCCRMMSFTNKMHLLLQTQFFMLRK